MQTMLRLSSLLLVGLLVTQPHSEAGLLPVGMYALELVAANPPPATLPSAEDDPTPEAVNPETYSCIPSGDHTSIQQALTNVGSIAVLCPDAVFELGATILFTHDNQEIYTEGLPTDSTRALLRIAHRDVATAVEAGNHSGLKLRHVIIDGSRPLFGSMVPALIEWGTTGTGNLVEWVKAYEPRGWSILYLGEGDDRRCSGSVARYNELGPGGHSEYGIADGISLGCRNSIVEHNTIFDVTDGGIVIFQAPGSLIANNTIRSENRIMFYGISMEDHGPYDGDFTGTVVTGNTIDGQGALIRRGIAMGPHVGCIPAQEATLRSRGAVVTNNTLMGDHLAYGMVASGVENWTATGNVDLSMHIVPDRTVECFEETVDAPGGFQLNPVTSSGTFQEEFEEAVLGFTNQIWMHPLLASEPCLGNLIGQTLLEEIRTGQHGSIWIALEQAPNGEMLGQCIGTYDPPDVSALVGHVVVELIPCQPYCLELKLTNISFTETANIEGAAFIMNDFLVSCSDLPATLEPWESAQCTIEDWVADDFNFMTWFGFKPDGGSAGFTYTSDVADAPVSSQFLLAQNYPNPFTPSTAIRYTVPEGDAVAVHLNVYDIRGRLVRILIDENKTTGRYSIHWDGKNDDGKPVSAGVYLCRIEAGRQTAIRKMTILK